MSNADHTEPKLGCRVLYPTSSSHHAESTVEYVILSTQRPRLIIPADPIMCTSVSSPFQALALIQNGHGFIRTKNLAPRSSGWKTKICSQRQYPKLELCDSDMNLNGFTPGL